ncbi:hypothetical protein GDO78_008352 [Eleutherodactylus coqui]|uniref:Uncharacterized protein n=1 Tax=Eleutherodactylus coqui TaxID=57060 RepID=A0A8J6FBU6_ELECQ|nr:hypothetical protein GDO78_008352 [Eleutherodactylus coqui]
MPLYCYIHMQNSHQHRSSVLHSVAYICRTASNIGALSCKLLYCYIHMQKSLQHLSSVLHTFILLYTCAEKPPKSQLCPA